MRAPRDSGFTLLELLVALAVFVVLAALVYGVVRMGSRSWESGMARIDEAETMRIGWSFVQGALSNSRPEPSHDSDVPGIHFLGGASALEFVADLPAHLARGGLHVLRLQLEPDADTGHERLVLRSAPLRNDDDAPPRGDVARVQQAVLADDVAALAIRYYGQVAEDDEGPRWYAQWQQQDSLPTLVRIDVALADGHHWPVLVAHPRLGHPTNGASDAAGGEGAAVVGGQRRPPGGWRRLDRRAD